MIRITSPHLSIYQPQLNSFYSVFMRITGGLEFIMIAFFVLTVLFSEVLKAFPFGSYIHIIIYTAIPYFVSFLFLLTIFHFVFSVDYVNTFVSFVRPRASTELDAFTIEDFEFLTHCKLVVTFVLYVGFLGFLFY